MRSVILMGCLWMLSIAGYAQSNGRVASGTPLRWGKNGSVDIMPGDLAYHYGSNDTATAHKRNLTSSSIAWGGHPNTTGFASVRIQCDHHSMTFNWTSVQQFGADRYEIEQSDNGRNWTVVGVIPANRTDYGTASYSFNYNKNLSNSLFRVSASNIAGERVLSQVLEAPCSNTNYIGITPNPVYSTTMLRIGSPTAARVNIVILDTKGSVMHRSDASLLQGTNDLLLNLSGLPSGNYTLVIRWINGKQEVLQLVKQ